MAQMIVRNIDEAVSARFRARAKAEGKSAEQALRDLIAEYGGSSREAALAELRAIREANKGKPPFDPVAAIREDRDTDHARG